MPDPGMLDLAGLGAFIVVILREVFDFLKKRRQGDTLEAIQRFGMAIQSLEKLSVDSARETHDMWNWHRPGEQGFRWYTDRECCHKLEEQLIRIEEVLREIKGKS